jgi:hypothetical protein
MALDWVALEHAVFDWAVAASGLPPDSVLWANAIRGAPESTYLVLRLTQNTRHGSTAIEHRTFDAGRVGEEVEARYIRPIELGIGVQGVAARDTGETEIRSLLGQIASSVDLPRFRAMLAGAGISVLEVGSISVLEQFLGPEFAGRASLDIRAAVLDDSAERTTYVEHVTVNGPLLAE